MKVSVAGAGNLGSHLVRAMINARLAVRCIYSRSWEKGEKITSTYGIEHVADIRQAQEESDILLLAISDDAIEEVLGQLNQTNANCIVAHTAGSVSSNALALLPNYGVFYPLQTFTAGRELDWQDVPILITGSTEQVSTRLSELASVLSRQVSIVSDKDRFILHLGATIANNFGNHMFALANDLLSKADLEFDLLKPLILETTRKILAVSPIDAQTGAAIRNDSGTMQKHLELLKDDPSTADLYRKISDSIRSLADREL